ncbi:hypothetical protein KJ705_04825 [Patescibacteria group bacterium]|nr:hypothetical protein [Patescibacteria group bacterium]
MDLSNIPEREEILRLRIFPMSLEEIRKLDVRDIRRVETFDRLFVTFLDPEFFCEMGDSVEIINTLTPIVGELETDFPDLHKKYQDLLLYGEIITIPVRTSDQVQALLESSLVRAIEWKIDVRKVLNTYFVFHKFPFDLLGDDRVKLLKGIQNNKERIGNKQLETERGNKRDPLVENWIRDFISFFDRPGLKNPLDEINYMSHSKKVAGLDPKEKEILKEVIRIYDYANFPTPLNVTPTDHVMFEEPNQEEPVLTKSVPMPVPAKDPEVQRTKLIEEFLGSEEDRDRIHKEETNLEQVSNEGLRPVIEIFVEAVHQKDKYKAIAALRVAAEKGDLLVELKNNQRVSTLAKEILQDKYKPETMADFQRNGFTASYLSVFLQHVFKEKMGLDDAESARFGVQLENILAEKGHAEVQGMVYGDLASGKYAWQEVKDEGVRLSIPEQGK